MILITGINGFIGSHIAKLLVARGEKVRGLVRKTSNLSNLSELLSSPRKRGSRRNDILELIEGDICSVGTLREAFDGIDICYHTAALVKAGYHPREEYFSANLQGTINVCAEAMRVGVKKFIYTSTCETLRACHCERSEAIPQNKLNAGDCHAPSGLTMTAETVNSIYSNMAGDYGRSKFLAEEHVKACIKQGLPAIILNPTGVVGPGDTNLTPPNAMILAYCKGKIPFYFETGFNIVDVRDVATGHLLACKNGRIGERYILGNNNVMLSKLFTELKKGTGYFFLKKVPVPFFPIRLPFRIISAVARLLPINSSWKEKIMASKQPFFLDSTKAKNELGWQPKFELQTTLKDALNWLCNHC